MAQDKAAAADTRAWRQGMSQGQDELLSLSRVQLSDLREIKELLLGGAVQKVVTRVEVRGALSFCCSWWPYSS